MNERITYILCRATRAWRALAVMTLATLLGAASAMAQAPSPEDLPGRVGRVADVGGELFLAPQDKPDAWQPVGLNYPVANGDNLWVGNDGRAEIDLGGTQLRLAGDSNLHISRLDDRQFALFVAQGRVSVRVRVLEAGETAQIDTPNAQIAITRPGLYRIDVSQDREHSHLIVREGEANVVTQGAVQQVLPGQSADIDGTDPRFATVQNGVGMDGFDTWVAGRDRRYQGSRTANYVSPQMAGAAELDQYGTWTQTPDYGAVWYPTDVPSDWAPYRNGYWTEVGAWGPTWVDYAPWGYAPFHYGRWAYIGGRWGWAPGRYVARPLWAPALVGWTGGAGWGVSVSVGGPVYGWVPLAWGEPYRPWWGRCSNGCWDRYNRPYNVNVTVVRPNSPPPTRYVNFNAPNGITAVSSTAFMAGRPVQQNMVRVSRDAVASSPPPVMASAPQVRNDAARAMGRRPDNAPPPASTFQPTTARQTIAPSMMGGRTATTDPNARARPPMQPATSQPSAMGRTLQPTPMTPGTVTPAPQPSMQRGAQPSTASTSPAMRAPQPQSPQFNAQQPQTESRSFNRMPPPSNAQAQPQPQPRSMQQPDSFQQPQQSNQNRGSRQPMQAQPAPVQQPQQMQRAAPQPVPQPQAQRVAPPPQPMPQAQRVAPPPQPMPQQHAAPQPAPQPHPQRGGGDDNRGGGNDGGGGGGGNAQRSQR